MHSQLCFYLQRTILLIHIQPYNSCSYKKCLQALFNLQRVASKTVSNFPTPRHHIFMSTDILPSALPLPPFQNGISFYWASEQHQL